MSAYLVKGARLLGGDPDRPAAARRPGGRGRHRPGGRRRRRWSTPPGWSRCPAWSTCTPTCASPAARTPRRSRPARPQRLSAVSPRSSRWRTPTRWPTPPAWSSRCGGSAAAPAAATCVRSERSPSGWPGERLAELGAMADSAAGVRVFSDDGHCVDDAVLMRRALEYVKAIDGVVAQHAQEPRLTAGAQMHEGTLSGVLGLAGWPAVAEEAVIARDVLLADHVGCAAARLPRLHRGVGRDHPVGQVARGAGHRRGDAAPPAADPRPRPRLRPRLQGQPAAAHADRRRGAARRPGRRHHRRRRHRPRAAPGGGQGLRVVRRRDGHDRARDRAVGRPARDGRHRAARLGRGRAG